MENTCEIYYSPFVRCGSGVCGSHNGMKLCLRHLITSHRQEDCSICLSELTDGDVILLTCGHMFHYDCMSSCRAPECPLCRKQLEPSEAIKTVGKITLDKIATQLYLLPVNKIKTAVACINIVLRICAFAPKEMYDVLKLLIS